MCIEARTTGDQGAANDDITNILRNLIFTTLLEVSVCVTRCPDGGNGAELNCSWSSAES